MDKTLGHTAVSNMQRQKEMKSLYFLAITSKWEKTVRQKEGKAAVLRINRKEGQLKVSYSFFF